MKSFDEIWQRTLDRKGSIEAIESRLPTVKTEEELEAIPDHRWLAEMTRSVFRAGFSWKVIDAPAPKRPVYRPGAPTGR